MLCLVLRGDGGFGFDASHFDVFSHLIDAMLHKQRTWTRHAKRAGSETAHGPEGSMKGWGFRVRVSCSKALGPIKRPCFHVVAAAVCLSA